MESNTGRTTNTNDNDRKDRLESVDTIRQILFGEDRRVIDDSITKLSRVVDALSKSHAEDLSKLEARLTARHDAEINSLKRMLSDNSANFKTALSVLETNALAAVKNSDAAFDIKSRNIQQTLQADNKAMHEADTKHVEEKLLNINQKIHALSQTLAQSVTSKQFTNALRAIADLHDSQARSSTATIAPSTNAPTMTHNPQKQ